MTEFFGILLFLFPILSGIILAAVKTEQVSSLFRVQLSGMVLIGVYLSTAGKFIINTPLAFMGEPLWFSFSLIPSSLFLVTILTLLVLLLAVRQENGKLSRPDAVFLNFALVFGLASFFSGQFLMRYIALEIVGLIAALSTLEWAEDPISFDRFSTVFFLLRLADLSLLISIILLWVNSGTLNIDEMIRAAVKFPADRQIWIMTGVAVSAAIKLAVSPFWTWLGCAERKNKPLPYWTSVILIPSLGMYLLYRFVPIIQSQAIFQISLVIAASVLLIHLLILLRTKRAQVPRLLVISDMMGAMIFYGAASGSSGALVIYALGFIIIRLIVVLQDHGYSRISQHRAYLLLLIVLSLPGFFLYREADFMFLWGWVLSTAAIAIASKTLGLLSPVRGDLVAGQAGNAEELLTGSRTENQENDLTRRMDRALKPGYIMQRINGLPVFINQTAAWLYANVEQSIDQQWMGLERMLLGISRLTLTKIEQAGSEKADSLVRDLVYRIGEHEKHIKENPFWWALVWIPVMLAAVLFILLSS